MKRSRQPPRHSAPPAPRPASVPLPAAAAAPDRLHSAWIGLAVLLLLVPTLARTPQSGDGAEIVTVALRGGVLHPTGFPLQAWLDRALALIPGIPVAWAISLLGLVAHAGAALFAAEALRLLGVGAGGRVLGTAAFALFPPLWGLAVEPEVFALAHFLIAAALWAALKVALAPPRDGARAAALLGLLGAAAAAQHPVALAAFPALIFGLARVAEPRRAAALLAFGVTAVGGTVIAYASLPLLRTASPWPDWGALASAGDVARHALRVDYGTFAMSAAEDQATRSALALWGREVLRSWSVAALLAIAGAWALVARRELRVALAPVGGALAVGLAILWRGRLPDQSYSDAYLAKLQGPATIAAALLIGLGWSALTRRAGPRLRLALGGVVGVAVAAALVLGWPRADASRDRTLDLYARGVGLELRADQVYVTEGEVEAFLGAPTREGRRFPISAPMAGLDWYVRRVAPRLEPRVLGPQVSIEDWGPFLGACFARRHALVSTSRDLIATTAGTPELRGLVYVARPGGREELTPASVAAAVRLAPLANQLPALPPGSHEFSRFYVRRFARAYAGAAVALARLGANEAASRANEVAAALDRGEDPARRRRIIDAFLGEARAIGFR